MLYTMLYQCDKCKKQFDRKSNYLNHLNRQKKCTFQSKTKKLISFKCQDCNKSFSRKQSVDRHMPVCKGKPVVANTGDKIITIGDNCNNNIIGDGKMNINLMMVSDNDIHLAFNMHSFAKQKMQLEPNARAFNTCSSTNCKC